MGGFCVAADEERAVDAMEMHASREAVNVPPAGNAPPDVCKVLKFYTCYLEQYPAEEPTGEDSWNTQSTTAARTKPSRPMTGCLVAKDISKIANLRETGVQECLDYIVKEGWACFVKARKVYSFDHRKFLFSPETLALRRAKVSGLNRNFL